jgi:hypothetical protein
MVYADPFPLATRAAARSGSERVPDLPLLLERAIDRVDQAFRGGNFRHAMSALRDALLGATGRASGAARLAHQMRLWYREAPDRARTLSRAALAETVAAALGN